MTRASDRGSRASATFLALGAFALGACSSTQGQRVSPDAGVPVAGNVGSSIALVAGGTSLAVVNPDQGSISFLDPTTLAQLRTTVVGGEPHALLDVTRGGEETLVVATYRSGELVAVDSASGAVQARVKVCAGPYGLAASPDGTWVAVTCEWDGSVQRVDVESLAIRRLATGLRRPRAVVVRGEDVYAADYVGGNVHAIHPDAAVTTTSLVPSSAPYRPALTAMTANLTAAVTPAFGELFFAHVLENNTGDTVLEAVADDYGSVLSTNPKINPSVTTLAGTAPVLYAKFDGGSRVYSGPSAIASFGSHYLLVAHVSTANVAVLDTTASTPDARAVGTFSVGSGPSGIAVDEKHGVAFVDNALDQSVSRLDLTQAFATPAPLLAADATLVRPVASPYSAEALAGRRLFFDATNPHVTPSGVVACASCHPGGSDDGLVWFIHTPSIPLKRRRTPHLANATTGTAPFHWNGQFATMSDLATNTMTNLMAGDALLVDVGSIQRYIDEIVKPPLLPVTDPPSVQRGQVLFASPSIGCATCHPSGAFTDDLLHPVLTPMSLHADDVFPTANTPGLLGVFLRAPYFHDGRAATLEDVLTQPYAAPMDHTAGLSSGDVDDLIAYLESL